MCGVCSVPDCILQMCAGLDAPLVLVMQHKGYFVACSVKSKGRARAFSFGPFGFLDALASIWT